jgi:hypothetical protein
LVAVFALAVWLATRRDGPDSSEPLPRFLSRSALIEAGKDSRPPIYWAGSAINAEYGLLEVEGGFRVLYVPGGVHSRKALSRALTVGSYPALDPEAEVRSFARQPGAIVRHAQDGRTVVSNRSDPTSVYLADPAGGVEVEVYAPEPERAMRLALSGRVRPVG